MKVAYSGTGFDSKNEPGPVAGGSGGIKEGTGSGYCHTEQSEPYPAAAGYAEELTGLKSGTTVYGDSGVLWFVNPWITGGNSNAILTSSGALHSGTTLYIYVVIINTGSTAYAPTTGTLDLTWYGSNHFDGYLIGVYYNGAFYPTAPIIPPGAYYYAIFEIVVLPTFIGNPPWASGVQTGAPSVMFWGSASITNALNGNSESSEGQSFFSGTILVSGLWIRYEPNSGGCA
jgi:hypothetical protein